MLDKVNNWCTQVVTNLSTLSTLQTVKLAYAKTSTYANFLLNRIHKISILFQDHGQRHLPVYTSGQKIEIINTFLCLPKLHLFDKKIQQIFNIVKYYTNFKEHFLLIH